MHDEFPSARYKNISLFMKNNINFTKISDIKAHWKHNFSNRLFKFLTISDLTDMKVNFPTYL